MSADGLDIGSVLLGRYQIVHPLAKGGQGEVYLARNEGAAGFIKPVVVKRTLPHLATDAEQKRMMAREARILSSLRHPGIVNIIDFAEDVDGAYITILDYVHGYHLGKWYRYVRKTQGPFSQEIALHIMLETLAALHYAHTHRGPGGQPQNIVHRDVTPANVLIDVDGHVKLADFGIARTSVDMTDVTSEGLVKGNFPYVAPELFASAQPTPACDIYSSGIVLYEVLSGNNPMRGQDLRETVAKALSTTPPPLDAIRPDISSALASVVQRAISKDPADRFPTASAFAEALRTTRQASEERAAWMLATQASTDFRSPEMSQIMNVTPLHELERLWNERDTEKAVSLSDPPPTATVEILGETQPSASKPPTLSRVRNVTVIVFLLALMGAGGFFAWRYASENPPAPRQEDPPFVVVSANERADEPTTPIENVPDANPPEADAAPTAVKTKTKQPIKRRNPPVKRQVNRAVLLTRLFAKQQRRITACFQKHPIRQALPRVSVRITINTAGVVQRAEVLPPAVGSTPLGSCIAKVAQTTSFGPQPDVTTFRIPITTRVSQ